MLGVSSDDCSQLMAESFLRNYPHPKCASLPKGMPLSLRQICIHNLTKTTAIYLASVISGSCHHPHCYQEGVSGLTAICSGLQRRELRSDIDALLTKHS